MKFSPIILFLFPAISACTTPARQAEIDAFQNTTVESRALALRDRIRIRSVSDEPSTIHYVGPRSGSNAVSSFISMLGGVEVSRGEAEYLIEMSVEVLHRSELSCNGLYRLDFIHRQPVRRTRELVARATYQTPHTDCINPSDFHVREMLTRLR